MAHLSKQLRTMKRILILLLALMPVMVSAQGYKNLPKIEVPDYPANEIRVSKNRINTDSWNVSFALASKGMGVNFDLPFTYDMYFKTDKTMMVGTSAVLLVGGEEYPLSVTYASGQSTYIDITLKHITHISFSGLQGVIFKNSSGIITHEKKFNEIEQELWRRTAEQTRELVVEMLR